LTPQELSIPICHFCGPDCNVGYGFCHCGCGRLTSLSRSSRKETCQVLGKPLKCIRGHRIRERRIPENARPFRIDGVYCRLIPLNRGLYAIVWESDYMWLMQWTWGVHWNRDTRSYYACRTEHLTKSRGGKKVTIGMHRQIMGLANKDGRIVDHIDSGNTLDNRRSNLRITDRVGNNQNARTRRDNKSSGLKCISWFWPTRKWRVRVQANKQRFGIGYYALLSDAIVARDEAIRRLHGKFARIK
jgi:hypothetical protein